MMAGRMFIGAPVFTDQDFVPLVALWWPRLGWPENIGWNHCQPGLTKPPPAGFHGSKKTVGKPVKPAGLLLLKKYRHGLLVGAEPVRVPGRTGSTGNR
jgi:hypothetical protein